MSIAGSGRSKGSYRLKVEVSWSNLVKIESINNAPTYYSSTKPQSKKKKAFIYVIYRKKMLG